MLPFYKLLSLFLRVFSRPLINLTRKHHAAHGIQNQYIKAMFFKLGTRFHKFEAFINRRYLKSDNKASIRQLSQPLAIDKGIQFFYEIIFYGIALGFPTYELIKAARDTKKKEEKLKSRVENLSNQIKRIQANKTKILNSARENHHLSLFSFQLITKYFLTADTHQYSSMRQYAISMKTTDENQPSTKIMSKLPQNNRGLLFANRPIKELLDLIV